MVRCRDFLQSFEVARECRFVLKTAQVEDQRLLGNPADDRDRETTESRSERRQRAPGTARCRGSNCKSGTGDRLLRECARTDLTLTGHNLAEKARPHGAGQSWEQTLSERVNSFARTPNEPKCRKSLTKPLRIAIEPQCRFNCGKPDFVNPKDLSGISRSIS